MAAALMAALAYLTWPPLPRPDPQTHAAAGRELDADSMDQQELDDAARALAKAAWMFAPKSQWQDIMDAWSTTYRAEAAMADYEGRTVATSPGMQSPARARPIESKASHGTDHADAASAAVAVTARSALPVLADDAHNARARRARSMSRQLSFFARLPILSSAPTMESKMALGSFSAEIDTVAGARNPGSGLGGLVIFGADGSLEANAGGSQTWTSKIQEEPEVSIAARREGALAQAPAQCGFIKIPCVSMAVGIGSGRVLVGFFPVDP